MILELGMSLLLVPLLPAALSESLSLFKHRRRTFQGSPSRSALLFLVPAHNEALIIRECVRALGNMTQVHVTCRVVVIADNCTDETATVARESGAEVLERQDPGLPGKPRAIAWALERLPIDQYDACVIVDADSTVDAGFAEALATHMPLRGKAVQAYYATRNESENWLTRLAGVLARCRYEVSYPLRARAGLNCPLTGNGMCLGADLVADGGWQAFSLTENWELYASYTAAGTPIEYSRDAILFSQEARSLRQGGTQRRRWLAGRMWVLRTWWRSILFSSRIGWHQKLDAIGELAALSPVLHMGVVVLLTLAAALAGSVASLILAVLAWLTILPLMVGTVVSIGKHPQPWRTVAAFAMLPGYAVWRVFTAIRTFLAPQRVWTKSERHQDLPVDGRAP